MFLFEALFRDIFITRGYAVKGRNSRARDNSNKFELIASTIFDLKLNFAPINNKFVTLLNFYPRYTFSFSH